VTKAAGITARSDDVIGRLDAVLDESKRLIRDYPYLGAFLRAIRGGSTVLLRHGGPKYPGSKALRDVVTDIVADAQAHGTQSPETGGGGRSRGHLCADARSVGAGGQSAAGRPTKPRWARPTNS
jgi:hypothetical protein